MAQIALGGNPVHTNGDLPQIGATAPNVTLVDSGLGRIELSSFKGSNVVLNIFPSIDTSTCATSVREFNKLASELQNTKVLCISRDLPFAQKRFCGAEGIENVACLSDFESGDFGKQFGLHLTDGPLAGLHARAVVVLDENGVVKHTELVPDIKDEPNYQDALNALS